MNIAIIRTGTANLASVKAAFVRLGVPARVVTQPTEINADDAVVLPGVGAFAAGMRALTSGGWDRLLIQRLAATAPTLAICLGFQLLCESSEESPGITGLGYLPVKVRRLPVEVTVPHLGWNELNSPGDFFENGYVYYANSYCVNEAKVLDEEGWEVATTTHGIRFVSAIRRGAIVACQFHPELSGDLGSRLLSRWLAVARETRAGAFNASHPEGSSC